MDTGASEIREVISGMLIDWEAATPEQRQDALQKADAAAEAAGHDCYENAVPYVSDGALGHGWECGICGRFLQAG